MRQRASPRATIAARAGERNDGVDLDLDEEVGADEGVDEQGGVGGTDGAEQAGVDPGRGLPVGARGEQDARAHDVVDRAAEGVHGAEGVAQRRLGLGGRVARVQGVAMAVVRRRPADGDDVAAAHGAGVARQLLERRAVDVSVTLAFAHWCTLAPCDTLTSAAVHQ